MPVTRTPRKISGRVSCIGHDGMTIGTLQSIFRVSAGIEGRFTRGAAIGFAYQIAGLVLGFVLNVVLARALGARGYGIYAFAVAVATLGAAFGRLGLDNAALRLLPEYRVDARPALAHGLISQTRRSVAAASAIIGAVAAAMLGLFWHEPEHARFLFLAAVAALVPAMALLATAQAGLRGLGALGRALSVDYLIRPIAIMAAVSLLWIVQHGRVAPLGALAATLGVMAAGIALQQRWIVRDLRTIHGEPDAASCDWGRWSHLSIRFLGSSVFTMVFSQSDLIVLGLIRRGADVGYYSAAARMAMLVGFGLSVLNVVAAPLISELHAAQNGRDLQRLLTLMIRAGGFMGLVLALCIVGLAPFVLPVFGAGFEAARTPLLVLIAGQVVNVAAGPVGLLLLMTDHQGAVLKISMGVSLLGIALAIFGVLYWGMLGAAAATAISVILWDVTMIVYIHRSAGFLIVPLVGAFART